MKPSQIDIMLRGTINMNTIYEEKTKLSLGGQLLHRLTIHVYYISTISF